MRRFWKSLALAFALLGFTFWLFMPLKVERTTLDNVIANFQSWLATDLDGDNNAEILLSYAHKPPVLMSLQGDKVSTTTLFEVDDVILPPPDPPQKLLLPLTKSVPAKKKGKFWLMRLERGLVSLQPFPGIERPDHVVWLDADDDSKFNDLIVREGEKRFWFVLDERGEWKFKAQLPSGPKRPLIGVADLDGDGRYELLASGQNYSVLWGEGEHETNLGSSSALKKVQPTDLDNDGRAEIVALEQKGASSRLVVLKFDHHKKRFLELFSTLLASHDSLIVNGQKFPLSLDDFWVVDLDGDGLKEVIVYANDQLLRDILFASVVRRHLRIWSSSLPLPSAPVVSSSPLSSSPKISLTSSSWFLVVSGGKRVDPQKIEVMKGAQQPVASLPSKGQGFILTQQHKWVQRFRPRILSFNPFILTWQDEGIVIHGTLWQVSKIASLKTARWERVLDFVGSPKLIADFNGDERPEILFTHEPIGTIPANQFVVGVVTWKLGRWRKATWTLTGQRERQRVFSPGFSSLWIFSSSAQISYGQQIHILPLKTEKGFEFLIAPLNGSIELVRIR